LAAAGFVVVTFFTSTAGILAAAADDDDDDDDAEAEAEVAGRLAVSASLAKRSAEPHKQCAMLPEERQTNSQLLPRKKLNVPLIAEIPAFQRDGPFAQTLTSRLAKCSPNSCAAESDP